MDAASRAELDALRRRAFGPDADIRDDPAALARLIELEELAHPPVAPAADDAPEGGAAPEAAPLAELARDVQLSIGPDAGPERADLPQRHRRARRGTLIAGAAAVAAIVVAVVLAQPRAEPESASAPTPTVEASQFALTPPPEAATLMRIRRDGAFGGYIELPSDIPPPPFPATAPLDWAAYLGDYFSWDLWIAGGTGDEADEHCILIRRADEIRARCADAEGQRRGTLHVSLAGPDIPSEELPAPMTDADRIRFWWLDSGTIEVLFGPLGPN